MSEAKSGARSKRLLVIALHSTREERIVAHVDAAAVASLQPSLLTSLHES